MAKNFLAGLNISTRAAVPVDDVKIWADSTHPNKLKFKGILVRLDEPSTKPPEGSRGHLIQLPTDVAQRQLDTLIGMGVNYDDSLAAHAPTKKVGVIEKAWIKGNALWVSGYVWAQDFPDAEKVLRMSGMGMSMELTGVRVEDPDADVWILTDFTFTGATFLRKSNAAYFDTSAIAAAADTKLTIYLNTEAEMPNKNNQTRTRKTTGAVTITDEQKLVARVSAAAAGVSISKQLGPVLLGFTNAVEANTKVTQALLSRINASEDAGDEDEDNGDEDEAIFAAAKGEGKGDGGKGEDDEDTDDSDWDDDDSDDDEGDDVDGAGNPILDVAGTNDGAGNSDNSKGSDGDVGHINEKDGSKSRGNTSELEASLAAAKAKAGKWKTRAMQAAAQVKSLTAEVGRLRSKVAASGERLKANATAETRKSLTPTAMRLLSKGGVDVAEIRASGTMLDSASVDAMVKQFPSMSIEDRAAFKLELVNAGVMAGPGKK